MSTATWPRGGDDANRLRYKKIQVEKAKRPRGRKKDGRRKNNKGCRAVIKVISPKKQS